VGVGQFGPKVIGIDQFKREEALLERNAVKYGPRVLGYKHDFVSVERLAEILSENPYHVERFLTAEVHRPDGARMEALELLRSTEMALNDPDKGVVDRCSEAMKEAVVAEAPAEAEAPSEPEEKPAQVPPFMLAD
jgi:hypothetical protein